LDIRFKARRLDVIDPVPAAAAVLIPVNNHTREVGQAPPPSGEKGWCTESHHQASS
jgi:hypothetical protein